MTSEERQQIEALTARLRAKGVSEAVISKALGESRSYDPRARAARTMRTELPLTQSGEEAAYARKNPEAAKAEKGLPQRGVLDESDVGKSYPITRAYQEEGPGAAFAEAGIQADQALSQATPPAVRAGMTRFNDAVTLGGVSRLTRAIPEIGNRMADASAANEAAHPIASGLGSAAGYLTPGGIPGQIGKIGAQLGAQVAERAAPSLLRLGPAARLAAGAAGSAAEGAGVGAATSAGEAAVEGDNPAGIAERAKQAAILGGATGAGLRLARAGANAIRGGIGPIGTDIRLTEDYGGKPTPLPNRPVSPSPAKAIGVTASSRGRGVVGRGAADAMNTALETRAKAAGQQYKADMDKVLQAEGTKTASVEPVLAEIDRQMLRKDIHPSTRRELAATRAELAPPETDEIGNAPTLLDVHGRPGAHTFGAPSTPELPLQELNQYRQRFDNDAGVTSNATKMKRDDTPWAKLAAVIREGILPTASPAMEAVNQRYAKQMNIVRDARRSMRSERAPGGGRNPTTMSDESLGQRLASWGEEGSKVSGVREKAMENMRANFPYSDEPVGSMMETPQRILAEERMQVKKLPRIGGGGGDALNLAEPAVARGLYPLLRTIEGLPGGQIGTLLRAIRASRGRKHEGNTP